MVKNIERQALVAFSVTTFLVNTKFIAKKSSAIRTKWRTLAGLGVGD